MFVRVSQLSLAFFMFEFLGDFSELRLQLFRQFSLELSTMSCVDFGFRPQGEMRQLRDKLDSDLVGKVAQTIGCHVSNV